MAKGAHTITLENLVKIARDEEFFTTLDAVRKYCKVKLDLCAKAIGLATPAGFAAVISHKSGRSLNQDNLEKLLPLFESNTDPVARAIIHSLPQLRLKVLIDSESRLDLVKKITDYVGADSKTFKSISPTFAYPSVGTFTAQSIDGAQKYIAQNFPPEKHPVLHEAIQALRSEEAFTGFKIKARSQNLEEIESAQADFPIAVASNMFRKGFISGNAFNLKPASETLSM